MHLTTVFLLAHPNFPGAHLFSISTSPIPNLAFELLGTPLAQWFSPLVVGRLCLSVVVLIFVFAVRYLSKVLHGETSWLALATAFLIVSSPFLYGFINYCFGVCLFIATFAFWLKGRSVMKTWRFIVLCSILTSCAFIAHLSSYVFLLVAFLWISVLDLWNGPSHLNTWRRASDLLVPLIPLLPPLVLYALFMRSTGSVGELRWNTVQGKVISILGTFRGYSVPLDALLIVLLATLVFLLFRYKVLRVSWGVFSLGLVFIGLLLLSPQTIFTSAGADSRFGLPAFVLILVSINPTREQRSALSLLVIRVAVAALFAALLLRQAVVIPRWDQQSDLIRRQLTMIERSVPPGILGVIADQDSILSNKTRRALLHGIDYAAISKYIIPSDIAAHRTQQPLYFKTEPPRLMLEEQDTALPWDRIRSWFAYLWVANTPASTLREINENAVLVDSIDDCRLFKVLPVQLVGEPSVSREAN
jgi:hypothetical protein